MMDIIVWLLLPPPPPPPLSPWSSSRKNGIFVSSSPPSLSRCYQPKYDCNITQLYRKTHFTATRTCTHNDSCNTHNDSCSGPHTGSNNSCSAASATAAGLVCDAVRGLLEQQHANTTAFLSLSLSLGPLASSYWSGGGPWWRLLWPVLSLYLFLVL